MPLQEKEEIEGEEAYVIGLSSPSRTPAISPITLAKRPSSRG